MSDAIAAKPRSLWQAALLVWIGIAMAYVFLIPVGNNLLLYPVLLSFALIAGVHWLRHPIKPDKSFIWLAGCWTAFLVVGIVSGLAQNAESWARTLIFFLIWPAVYTVIIAGFDRRVVKLIFWVGAIVTVVIGLVFFAQGLAVAGHLPFRTLPPIITDPIAMKYLADKTGMIDMSSTTLPPLIWWGGMWVASLFVDSKDSYLPPVWLRGIAATLAVAGAFISWRRAVVLIIIGVPLVALLGILVLVFRNVRTTSPRISWRGIIGVAVVFVLALGITLMVQPSIGTMISHLVGSSTAKAAAVVEAPPPTPAAKKTPVLTQKDIAKSTSTPMTVAGADAFSDKIRANEVQSLTKTDGPVQLLVGRGFGATFDRDGIKRDMRPWQTELQYLAIYNWTGLVGILLLIATVIAGLGAVRKAFRIDDDLRGVLFVASVGSVAVIVADGTNPYLQAPGHMWPLFFPLMIASAIFATKKRAVAAPELVEIPIAAR